jgi:Ca-activated chloride channel homolog
VLLSDGQQTDGRMTPDGAATRAEQQNVTVHTVGIGQRGVAARINNGRQTVGLDERTLQRVAETAGGEYFYAAETSELDRIYADLGSRISWVEERTEVTALASGLAAVLMLISGMLGLRWFQQLP